MTQAIRPASVLTYSNCREAHLASGQLHTPSVLAELEATWILMQCPKRRPGTHRCVGGRARRAQPPTPARAGHAAVGNERACAASVNGARQRARNPLHHKLRPGASRPRPHRTLYSSDFTTTLSKRSCHPSPHIHLLTDILTVPLSSRENGPDLERTRPRLTPTRRASPTWSRSSRRCDGSWRRATPPWRAASTTSSRRSRRTRARAASRGVAA